MGVVYRKRLLLWRRGLESNRAPSPVRKVAHWLLRRGPAPLYDPREEGTPSSKLPGPWFDLFFWSRRLESNQRPAVYEIPRIQLQTT